MVTEINKELQVEVTDRGFEVGIDSYRNPWPGCCAPLTKEECKKLIKALQQYVVEKTIEEYELPIEIGIESLYVTNVDRHSITLLTDNRPWPGAYAQLYYEECQKLIEILEQVKPFEKDEEPFN